MPARKPVTISFPLKFASKPGDDIELVAFLFSRNGKLLEKTDVKSEKVAFKKKVDPKKVRVLIAPKGRGAENSKKITELRNKYHAYEPQLTLNDGKFEILPIPEILFPNWLIRKCRVRGDVSKYFEISGFSEKRPLCEMRVHICEVDRLIFRIPRLPDDILVKIPDLILDPHIPIPVDPDPPFPDPQPGPDPLPNIGNIIRNRNVFDARRIARPELRRSIEQPVSTDINRANAMFGQEITARLMTRQPSVIQAVLQENFHLFHPVFCHIPWLWPYFYRCDELAVVQTDMNGQFDTNIWYHLLGDKPDLYFWVEAFIDGEWKTVYRPNIPCNTYWDYQCGKEVHITVTDPRVMWGCDNELEGEIIWVKTIGHGTSVSHIQQTNGNGAPIQGTSMNRIGLTDKTHPKGDNRSPFGTSLYFVVQFSSGLPVSKYSYYRWSYQKIGNADLSPAATGPGTLNNVINKRYTFEVKRPNNTKYFDADNFKLGPFTVGGTEDLYRIPPPSPEDAPVNAAATVAADLPAGFTLVPDSLYWNQNTISTVFDSAGLDGDGLYEFTLELFDNAGNKVNDIPNHMFQMPHYDTFTPSIDAPNVNLNNNGAGICESFKMKVRIDNSKCEAEIYKIRINQGGNTPFVEADPSCCGFVPYAPNSQVEIEFRAFHPQNFANYSFRVNKGTCGAVGVANSSGMVLSKVGTPPIGGSVNFYVRNNQSRFKKVFAPNDLLGDCQLQPNGSEGKAAFAEQLHLDALSVNGNTRINSYDASALAAFALEPQ